MGLVAAALGIRREEQSLHDKLAASVTFAVKQYSAGVLLRDFHTAQVPSQDKKTIRRTRKDELQTGRLNTVLSIRDYRCEGLWVIAIELTEDAGWDIRQLKEALLKPKFTLYLGRKSCPLAAPLSPKIVTSDCLRSALDTEFEPILKDSDADRVWLPKSDRVTYYWQGRKEATNLTGVSSDKVWDDPVHRQRWQFSSRTEHSASKHREE
ncbi:type I-E CRISPR-associated protein Cas5/CasD [Bowmanella dokdonensis]